MKEELIKEIIEESKKKPKTPLPHQGARELRNKETGIKELYKKISNNVYKLRKENNLTLEKASEKLKVKKKVLYSIECKQNIKLHHLQLIARGYGVDIFKD